MPGDAALQRASLQRDRSSETVRFTSAQILCPIVVIASVLISYGNSFYGVFLFDDRLHILDDDKRLNALWPLWDAVTRRRPVVDYSLAINFRLSGESVWGYHATNVAVHILAALTLYGIVRRTLCLVSHHNGLPSLDLPGEGRARRKQRWMSSDHGIALAAAVLWAVHPLTTQSVTYLIQRAESLMGMFYLLTLYCVIRAATGGRTHLWSMLAVISCTLGMGSKAVMVTAPVVILLYDRVFLSRSWSRLLQERKWIYAGLAATWGVLWLTGTGPAVLNPATQDSNVGFSYKGIAPLEYAQTQCGVIVTYLRLALWPSPLCLDYAWPTAEVFGGWFIPGLAVTALIVALIRALTLWPRLAFPGMWFLVIIAPTSSFIPIRDTIFEHRMYLPLAGVVVLVVLVSRFMLFWIARILSIRSTTEARVAIASVVFCSCTLGYATIQRNKLYHGESNMWKDVLTKQPQSVRAIENYGTALLAEERTDEALPVLREATQRNPGSVEAHNGLGFALAVYGRYDEAMTSFRQALRLNPRHRRALVNLGNALEDAGRTKESIEHLQAAVRLVPRHIDARLNLGNALLVTGRADEAIEQYRAILVLEPRNAPALRNLATAMLNQGAPGEAIELLQRARKIEPESANTYNKLGIVYSSLDRIDDAISAFQTALRIEPNSAKIHGDFAKCLLIDDKLAQAEEHYRRAIQLGPGNPNFHYELGIVLGKREQWDNAVSEYRRTLAIDPSDVQARKALDTALMHGTPNPD